MAKRKRYMQVIRSYMSVIRFARPYIDDDNRNVHLTATHAKPPSQQLTTRLKTDIIPGILISRLYTIQIYTLKFVCISIVAAAAAVDCLIGHSPFEPRKTSLKQHSRKCVKRQMHNNIVRKILLTGEGFFHNP